MTIREVWPLAVGLLVALVTVGVAVAAALQATGGHVAYVLDDAYLQLTVARNLVESGTWGMNPGTFTTTASSISWPALLAAMFLVTGAWDGWPLVLDLVGVVGVVVAVDRALLRGSGPMARALTLSAVVLLAPLPALVLHGMEHVPHAALAAWLVGWGADRLAADEVRRSDAAWLAVAAVLAAATRYETLAVLGLLGLGFVIRRRWWLAAAAASGALPPLVYGGIAVVNGWPFLPIGAALKTAAGPVGDEGWRVVHNVLHEPVTTAVVLLAGLVAVAPVPRRLRVAAALVGITGVAQAVVGRFGEWGRYEGWLVVLAVAVLGAAAWELRRWRIPVVAGAVVLTVPLGIRAWGLTGACENNLVSTWRNPVQMALFVAEAYPDGVVGCTEAGAVSFYSDATVIDLAGLGHRGVAELFLTRTFRRDTLGDVVAAEHVQALPIIDRWMTGPRFGGVPDGWVKVAELAQGRFRGSTGYAFYAPTAAQAPALRAHLEAFAPEIPAPMQLRFSREAR